MSIQNQAEKLLDADEAIVRIDMKLLSEPPNKELMTEFMMTPKASVINSSWEFMLDKLQEYCDKTLNSDSAKMKMRAIVSVRKVAPRS